MKDPERHTVEADKVPRLSAPGKIPLPTLRPAGPVLTHSSTAPAENLPGNPVAPLPGTAVTSQPTGQRNSATDLRARLAFLRGDDGHAYAVPLEAPNKTALRVGSAALNSFIRREYQARDVHLRTADLSEINGILEGEADRSGVSVPVWYRVAPISSGIEVDMGDQAHTRVRITPGRVEVVGAGSETLFHRPPGAQPITMPAGEGNLRGLRKYLNVSAPSALLLEAWLSYTLAHPKLPSTSYVILVLQGQQGTGKSSLCKNVILKLIDPNRVGLQRLPARESDFAIAAQNAHVLAYDNIRGFRSSTADLLCMAATGAAITSRKLYTDSEQHDLRLHAALVLNGIHSFVNQGDLAQRCLPLQLKPISGDARRSEADMVRGLGAELPAIQQGLFELIAAVFKELPNVQVSHPERMIDFVHWLAAMERVHDAPSGHYQSLYSYVLQEGQLETVLDNVVGAAIMAFADRLKEKHWSGTPAELYSELSSCFAGDLGRSSGWPSNPIALSKRLPGLEASLLTQGIRIERSRGRHRMITVTFDRGSRHD